MEKKLPVITISREYAAYGRTIAAGLSEHLGIPYYDKDFVKETAKSSGYSEEDILKEGESMSRSSKFMNALLNNASSYASSYDGIYKAQKEVILELAKQPCIIVGRCADHVLREAGIESFDIFLYADTEARLERAKQLEGNQGLSESELRKVISKKDQHRSTYYKTYTKKDMGYYKNYNICLDVGRIRVENCLKLLCEILDQ
ncbi:MAG: cytidylate kinase-like family protein [Eubacteriales bacterium]|nr:cytidylate kinase-like family protein [Eubacteriales bacterium]